LILVTTIKKYLFKNTYFKFKDIIQHSSAVFRLSQWKTLKLKV